MKPINRWVLALMILLVISLAGQVQHTFSALDTINVFTNINQFTQGVTVGPIVFANLGTIAPTTSEIMISDAALGSNPCTGGGTGALAIRVNGSWNCNAGVGSGVGLNISTPGIGGVLFPTIALNMAPAYGTTLNPATAVCDSHVNGICQQQVILPYTATFSNGSTDITTNLGGAHLLAAIYNATGTTLITQITLNCASLGLATATWTNAPVTLSPGVYMYAYGGDSNISPCQTVAATQTSPDYVFLNALHNRMGRATNTISGGVFPATLGALAASEDTSLSPVVFAEP